MRQSPTIAVKTLSFAAFVCALMLIAPDAWANQREALSGVTKTVANNVRSSVVLIPMVCYVLGTFFGAAGLLKLKDWVTDGERNSIVPVIFRLVVAVFLILLPHTIRLTTGTFFRRANGDMNVNVRTPAPSLGAFCKSTDPSCGR